MKRRLIGLTGPAGCGKDSTADYLCAKYGFVRYAFAGPIKAMLRAIGVDADSRDTKELPHPLFGVSPRRMAQTLGTEWMREMVCEDGWLRLAGAFIDKVEAGHVAINTLRGPTSQQYQPTGIVFTDVRFENEAAFLRNRGGRIWHIKRSGLAPVEAHKSESGVSWAADTDYIIYNDESFKELHEQINERMR